MPTIRRRTPARRTRVQLDHWIEFEFEFGPLFRDREALEEAWEVAGEEFLAKYIQEHPGERPWAWWEFEAKHPYMENEAEYLTRHKLWTRGERARFEALALEVES